MTGTKRLLLVCGLLIAACLPASAAVNYVQNFESSTDGWTGHTSTGTAASTELSIVSGGQSGNCMQLVDGGWAWGASKVLPGVVEGEAYTLSMWVYFPSEYFWWDNSPTDPKVYVRQLDASNASVAFNASPKITQEDQWLQITVEGTIVAGATQVRIGIGDGKASGAGTMQIDTVSFTSVDLSAATRTWDGGGADDNFSTALNWGGTAPVDGDAIVFDGVTRLTPNLDANLSVTGLDFASGAGAFNITRSGSEILTSTGDIVNDSSNLQTIGVPMTLSGSGRTVDTGASGIALTAGTVAASGFTKVGTGALTLSGGTSPNLNGTITISAGTLALGSADQIANGAIVDVAPGAVFDLDGNNETIARFAASTSAGETRLGSGTLQINTGATGATTFYGGDIKGDAGSKFIKAGSGEIRLHKSSMVNTFEKLEVQNGIYRLGHGAAPNGTDAMLGAVPGSPLADQITLAGGTLSFNGQTAASRIDVNANRGITLTGNATIETLVDTLIPGNITGTGLLTKSGGRTLELTGQNDFSGGLTLAGPVVVSSADSVGTGTIKLNAGGSLASSTGGITITNHIDLTSPLVSTFAGTEDFTLSGDVDLGASGQSTEITIPSATVTMSGSLTNTLGLVKAGNGTLVLAGNSTFTGNSLVNAGTLHYASSGVTSAGSLVVKSGATLSGSGTASGEVTVESGATISAGSSVGTFNTGNQVWNGGGNAVVEVNDAIGTAGSDPGWDLLAITGTLTINATIGDKFNIDVVSLSGSAPGSAANFDGESDYSWTIVTTTGGITGFDPAAFNIPTNNFSDLPEGGTFTVAVVGNDLVLNYSTSVAPLITGQPTASQTVPTGTEVVLSATVTGTEPLTYVWEKDGFEVVDGGNISGATTATLTIANATPADSGSYVLIVENGVGSDETDPAVVTVIDPPVVTGQPNGATIAEGNNFNPTATVTGGGTLVYQWKKDGDDVVDGGNISGATTASLSITSVTVDQAGDYTLHVSNEVGNDSSSAATLVVQAAPVITAQPQDVATGDGATANFSVTATGHDLEYQWSRNGEAIVDATDSSYSVAASSSTIGFYTVEVSNNLGSVTSDTASLSIDSIPVMSEPFDYEDLAGLQANWGSLSGLSLNTESGNPAPAGAHNGAAQAHVWTGSSLSVTPTDEAPVVLKADLWYTGNVNQRNSVGFRTGANPLFEVGFYNAASQNGLAARFTGYAGNESWMLIVPYTTLGTGGGNAKWIRTITTFYTDSVTVEYDLDADGTIEGSISSTGNHAAKTFTDLRFGGPSALSSAGGGFMVDNIEISTQAPTLAIDTQPASLALSAGETAEFTVEAPGATTYQWKKDGVSISGATDSTLTLNNVLKADEGSYTVYIEDGYSTVNSDAATLTVVDPVIVTQPESVATIAGQPASFSVEAAGTGTLTYQWKLNGGDISGATDSAYNIASTSLADEGDYTVVVTGDHGFVTSDIASLDLQDGVFITQHPADTSVNEGASTSLTVASDGTEPLSYQWYLNDVEIEGATDATYVIAVATSADGGVYKVEVSNAVSSEMSTSATLTVVPDTIPAKIVVSSPKNKAIYTDPSLDIIGTVKDVVGVNAASIQYNFNDAGFVVPDSEYVGINKPTNFTAQVTLEPGTNTLEVIAQDLAGNQTTFGPIQFYYHTVSPLTIQTNLNGITITTNGVGAVVNTTPESMYSGDNTSLFVGRTYKLKAIETGKPAYILTNWTATWDGQTEPVVLQTNNLLCTFEMKSNMVLNANFIDNPFHRFGGIYVGLFSDTNSAVSAHNAGYAQIKITPKLTFSAKLFVDGNPVSISGKMSIDGNGTATSKSRTKQTDKPQITISLALDFENGTETLTGTIEEEGGAWTSHLLADRVIWSKKDILTQPTQYTNSYTALIPGFADKSEGPIGTGHGAMLVVTNLGKTKLVGWSSDFQKLKAATYVSKDGRVPYFARMYLMKRTNDLLKVITEAQGMQMGWLQLETNSLGNLRPVGEVHWIRTGAWTNDNTSYAGGFTNAVEIQGSRWMHDKLNAGATLTNMPFAQISFFEGEIGSSFTNVWLVDPLKSVFKPIKFTKPDVYVYENFVKAGIALKTGVFKGVFIHPTNPLLKTKYFGAILQDENFGEGTFMGPTEGGKVILESVPEGPTPPGSGE